MKVVCMILVFCFTTLSVPIETKYPESFQWPQHLFSSSTDSKNYWTLLYHNGSISYARNEHLIEVSLGNPPQNISLVLDTSNPSISVNKENCFGCHFSSHKFSENNSSTLTETNVNKTISYYIGDATGSLVTDTLRIAGGEIIAQPFILVEYNNFTSDVSGVLGLGYDADGVSFLTLLKNQEKIIQKSFSIHISIPSNYSQNLSPSAFYFGVGNAQNYSSEQVRYIELQNNDGSWEIPCYSAEFGVYALDHALTAKIDLGLKLIIGPTKDIKIILESLHNDYSCHLEGSFACDCNKNYPDFAIDLGGKKISIQSSDYFYKVYDKCYPLFDYRDIDFWLLGDIFIKRYYLVFDMEKKSLGIAENNFGKIAETPNSNSNSDYSDSKSDDSGGLDNSKTLLASILSPILLCFCCCVPIYVCLSKQWHKISKVIHGN